MTGILLNTTLERKYDMAVSMGGVVLWGRILGGSHTERSRTGYAPTSKYDWVNRLPLEERPSEAELDAHYNKPSIRRTRSVLESIPYGFGATITTALTGFGVLTLCSVAAGTIGCGIPMLGVIVGLTGLCGYATAKQAQKIYTSLKEGWSNNDNTGNKTQPIKSVNSMPALAPARPAPSVQPQDDLKAQRLMIVGSIKKAASSYTGDLNAAAQDACVMLENLAQASGVDGQSLPTSVSTIFNVVKDHLVGDMIPKFGPSGGQANKTATQLLLETFRNVSSVAGNQLDAIRDSHAEALDISAQVIDGSLKAFKPDPVYQMIKNERERQEAENALIHTPVPEMAPM
jgi:hypothetical protein